jgi:hypothetical protein
MRLLLAATSLVASTTMAYVNPMTHPAAARILQRHLEDGGDNNYEYNYEYNEEDYEDGNQEWYNAYDDAIQYGYDNNQYTSSCETDEDGSLSCTVCQEDGTYCVTEACAYTMDDDFTNIIMSCSFCSTRAEGGDNDYTFCMTLSCDLSSIATDADSDFEIEDICACDGATLNNDACSTCEMCQTDDTDYNALSWDTSTGALTKGLDLQCPNMYLLEADSDVSTCPASKRALLNPSVWAVPIGLGIVGLAIAVYYFGFHKPNTTDTKKEKLVDLSEHQESTAAGILT